MATEHQKQVNRFFPNRPIAYQPGLAIVFESPEVALLLCQLLYWHGKGRNKEGWIYKTIEELREETGLSRSRQDTAIGKLREKGLLQVRRKGLPARRYFKLDIGELLRQLPSLKENSKLNYMNPPDSLAPIKQTTSETTQRLQTKTTTKRASGMFHVGEVMREELERNGNLR